MASQNQGSILLLPLFFTLSLLVSSSSTAQTQTCERTGGIAVYWGQGPITEEEGSLKQTCATGNYKHVVLDYLYIHDDGSDPELNFAGHCAGSTCASLAYDINYCQSQNVQVLLSIGGDTVTSKSKAKLLSRPKSKSSSADDTTITEKVAEYIYRNFLSGEVYGPLGRVALDGIDFSSVREGKNVKWADLARAIHDKQQDRKLYLSASPQCVTPDYYLGEAIETGLFDYMFVEFFYYNPSCQYDTANGDASKLIGTWYHWASSVVDPTTTKVFLGIPASQNATGSGYMEPEVLRNEVLPELKQAPNYGGVTLYNRYFDKMNGYSDQIKDSVPKDCDDEYSDNSAKTKFHSLLRQYS